MSGEFRADTEEEGILKVRGLFLKLQDSERIGASFSLPSPTLTEAAQLI